MDQICIAFSADTATATKAVQTSTRNAFKRPVQLAAVLGDFIYYIQLGGKSYDFGVASPNRYMNTFLRFVFKN